MSTDAERRAEARMELLDERFDRVAVTCADCGERYDPLWVKATRLTPAYPRRDTCPACGSDKWVDS